MYLNIKRFPTISSYIFSLFIVLNICISQKIILAQLDTTYFLPPTEGWRLIGEAPSEDYQMCFGFGDFDGDSISELVGNYSHSAVGLFIHNMNAGKWIKSIIHPKFDPSNRIPGMNGSWPVKGFVSGDFDGDDQPELITMADQIMYPPAHGAARYPFPG